MIDTGRSGIWRWAGNVFMSQPQGNDRRVLTLRSFIWQHGCYPGMFPLGVGRGACLHVWEMLLCKNKIFNYIFLQTLSSPSIGFFFKKPPAGSVQMTVAWRTELYPSTRFREHPQPVFETQILSNVSFYPQPAGRGWEGRGPDVGHHIRELGHALWQSQEGSR